MNGTMLAQSVMSGVLSVPVDFYLGIERTFQDLNLSDGGHRVQRRNMNDDARVVRVIGRVFRNRHELAKTAQIIIDDALKNLPEPALNKLYEKLTGAAASVGSRTITQLALSSFLGTRVISGVMLSMMSRLAMRSLTGMMTGGIVAQGVVSRACQASRDLALSNPELWRKLRVNDYDMLYFLFKEPLKQYIELSETLRKNPEKSKELINAIENS